MIFYDFLLGLSVLVFIGIAVAYLRHPASALLHPATTYLGFHGLVFVVRPIFARVYDYQLLYRAFNFQPSISDKITVILGANLGFLVFMGVCLAIAGQPLVNRRNRFDELQRRAMRKPFMLAAILLLPVCIASAVAHWQTRAMAASTMIVDAATGATINTTDNGWFFTAQLALVPLSVTFAWLYRFRLWSLLPFAAFFVLRAGTGGRGPFVVAALALAMLYLFEKRKRWPEWRSTLLLIGVGFAFSFMVVDRGKAVRELFITDMSIEAKPIYESKPLETMDFANQEFFEFLVYAVPQRTGTYDYFLSNLQIFTEPVPRIWWKKKPVGPPIQLFKLFDYGSPHGMTQSLPGAGWAAFGYLGIVIQCSLFAAGYGWLYRFLMTRRQSNLYLLIYCLSVAATIVTYRDGILLTVLRQMPFYIGPIILIWLIMKVLGMPSSPAIRELTRAKSGARISPAPRSPSERRRHLAAIYLESVRTPP